LLIVLSLLRPVARPGWPPPDWAVVFCDEFCLDLIVLS
jgi:hypothetical protein